VKNEAPRGGAGGAAVRLTTRLDRALIAAPPHRFQHQHAAHTACKLTALTRVVRDHLESAADARRRGDHGAADAADLAALILLRAIGGNLPLGAVVGVPPVRRWP